VIVTSNEPYELAREAEALIDEADTHKFIEDLLDGANKKPGRPRGLPVKALFIALQMMASQGGFFLNDVPKVINAFSPALKKRLGLNKLGARAITFRQVGHLMSRIDHVLRQEFEEKDYGDDSRFRDFDHVFSALATAGAHDEAGNSLSVAVDASDIATWGTIKNVRKPVFDPETGELVMNDEGHPIYEVYKKNTDLDAGARGNDDASHKKGMFGYYLTAGVSVRDVDGPEVPRALVGARFRPANHKNTEMGFAVVGDVAQKRGRLGDVLVDRGYTASHHGNDFITPVRAMGGEPVFDLRQDQVGQGGIKHGAVIIDGRPYSPSISKEFRKKVLPPSSKGTNVYKPNPTELAEYQAFVEARSVYALVPNRSRRDNGTMVFQCPGAAGRLLCPLQAPRSPARKGTLPADKPPATALADSVCSSRYKSFDMTELPLYQRDIFGSKKWFDSYARRGSSVEPYFGALKDDAAEGLRRGRVRVRGLIKTGLMVAFALASTNRRLALSFEAGRARRSAGTAVKKTRGRPRRQTMTTYQRVVLDAQGRREVMLT
jgi:hypothetical protein